MVQKKEEKTQNCSFLDLDPRLYNPKKEGKRPKPADNLKDIVISPAKHQKTKIGIGLTVDMELLLKFVTDNTDHVFAWSPQGMLGIDPNFICHRLLLSPTVKPAAQRKRKQGEAKTKAIKEETEKLVKAKFILEVKYPT